MKAQLDVDKIAKGLGAMRKGEVAATGGYFGAMQLLAEIKARFRVPAGGGRLRPRLRGSRSSRACSRPFRAPRPAAASE